MTVSKKKVGTGVEKLAGKALGVQGCNALVHENGWGFYGWERELGRVRGATPTLRATLHAEAEFFEINSTVAGVFVA